MGAPFGGTWAVALNTDDAAYGGGGRGDKAPLKTEKIPCHDQQQSLTVDLPPMTTVILRCVRRNPVRRPKAEKAPAKKEAKAAGAPAKVKKASGAKAEKKSAPRPKKASK